METIEEKTKELGEGIHEIAESVSSQIQEIKQDLKSWENIWHRGREGCRHCDGCGLMSARNHSGGVNKIKCVCI